MSCRSPLVRTSITPAWAGTAIPTAIGKAFASGETDAPDGVIRHPLRDLAGGQPYGCGRYWFRKPGLPGHAGA